MGPADATETAGSIDVDETVGERVWHLLSLAQEETFGQRAWRLLNKPEKAKRQKPKGGYGAAFSLGRKGQGFEAHLRDEDCLALAVVSEGRANFLAIDIDRSFHKRLIILRSVLERRDLAKAAFAVGGSSIGHGKVVITLANRLPQAQAQQLIQEIIAEGKEHPDFGDVGKDISVYPTGGDGSYVRLLGRNRMRVGPGILREEPMDLDGDLSDLVAVEPASVEPQVTRSVGQLLTKRPESRAGRTLTLPGHVQRTLSEPFTGRTDNLFKVCRQLAWEARRLHGAAAGAVLLDWFGRIHLNSPELSPSSLRLLSRPDVVETVLRYADQHKPRAVRPSWSPVYHHRSSGYSMVVLRVYDSLSAFVGAEGLDPHAFAIDYGRIAGLAKFCDKKNARAAVVKAEEAGLLVRLDPGTPVRGGLCTLFCLRGEGQTIDEAAALGRATDRFSRRVEERARAQEGAHLAA